MVLRNPGLQRYVAEYPTLERLGLHDRTFLALIVELFELHRGDIPGRFEQSSMIETSRPIPAWRTRPLRGFATSLAGRFPRGGHEVPAPAHYRLIREVRLPQLIAPTRRVLETVGRLQAGCSLGRLGPSLSLLPQSGAPLDRFSGTVRARESAQTAPGKWRLVSLGGAGRRGMAPTRCCGGAQHPPP